MFLVPFLAAIVGGLLGGIATGATVIVVLRAKGQQWFIDPQVDYLEKKLKDVVVEQAFGQIGKLLERGEKIGQLATRVLEIVHLLRGGKIDPLPAGAPNAAESQLAAAHAAMGLALLRLGKSADARRELESALRLDPKNDSAAQALKSLDAVAPAEPVNPVIVNSK